MVVGSRPLPLPLLIFITHFLLSFNRHFTVRPLLFTLHGCFSELGIHVILAVIFIFFLETIELSKIIMFYGGIVFPMIMVVGCLWFMWLFIGSCFVLVFTFNSLSHCEVISFELLIMSTLVQWWLAYNHYLYHGWPSNGTSYQIITCVIHKLCICELWW